MHEAKPYNQPLGEGGGGGAREAERGLAVGFRLLSGCRWSNEVRSGLGVVGRRGREERASSQPTSHTIDMAVRWSTSDQLTLVQ